MKINRYLKTSPINEELEPDKNTLSAILSDLIQKEWANVDVINGYLVMAQELNNSELNDTLSMVLDDLYTHIGQFEGLLQNEVPEAAVIDDAKDSTEETGVVNTDVRGDLGEAYKSVYVSPKSLAQYAIKFLSEPSKLMSLSDEDGVIDIHELADAIEDKYELTPDDYSLYEELIQSDALPKLKGVLAQKLNLKMVEAPDKDYYLIPIGTHFNADGYIEED